MFKYLMMCAVLCAGAAAANEPKLSPRASALAKTALEHIHITGAIKGITATPETVALDSPQPIIHAVAQAEEDATLRACGVKRSSNALSAYPKKIWNDTRYSRAQASYIVSVYRLALEDAASRMKRDGRAGCLRGDDAQN